MFIKRVAAVVGAGIVLAAAIPTFVDAAQQFQGVIVKNTDADPVRTQEANRFSISVEPTTNGCAEVALPAGPVLIEHIDGFVGIDDDVSFYLSATSAVEVTLPNGTTSVGRSSFLVPLESAPWGTSVDATRFRLETALRVEDGESEVVGTIFRSDDDPLELCGSDSNESGSATGEAAVSGRLLR